VVVPGGVEWWLSLKTSGIIGLSYYGFYFPGGKSMSLKSNFDAIPIGLSLGTEELMLDEKTVSDRVALVQWQAKEIVDKMGIVPPGATIEIHPRMKFSTFKNLRASIWAKSEHEFLKPMKVGSKVTISGRVVEKYEKRGRYYLVSEYETVDEKGEVLMRSRETGVNVE
jgi:hypothetical protein